MQDGSFVSPGNEGTLKLDGLNASGGIRINTAIEFPTSGTGDKYAYFKDIVPAAGLNVPQVLKGLGIYPESSFTYGGDLVYIKNHEAERLPMRGGYWSDTSSEGVSALRLNYPRTHLVSYLGFRSAFCEKLKTV